tara:strand:- start:659 stop:1552 length:894 start_codon:yes stop_codon:yes gene_type:complete
MKPKDKYEIVKEGYENDFGRVDKPLGTLADQIADYWGGSPEADARARYLDTLREMNKQGGGRGGTRSAQGEMDRMDKRYQVEKKEKLEKEEQIKKDLDEKIKADKEREEFLDSPKGRMQTMFNDADKRDAILGGIADAMLETRTGADAYGNRFARAQKNVRDNLKISEATDIARQQAQLDAMKTMAETQKLVDPRQYLSSAQKEAADYVNAQIRAGLVKAEDYNAAYASMLKQIAVKDLTSAKASSISTLFTYAQALRESDPQTAGILMDAIKSNAIYLAGNGASGASGEVIDVSTL